MSLRPVAPLVLLLLGLLAGCSDDGEDAVAPSAAAPATASTELDERADCLSELAGEEVIISADEQGLIVRGPDGTSGDVQLDTADLAPEDLDALVEALAAHRRTVRVTVPEAGGTPRPVLLEFHGYTSSAAEMALYSGLSDRAGERGYVVVAIDGREDPRRWELTAVDADPSAMATSDVAVVDAVLDVLLPSFCGDPGQLHAAGMSNGSVFSAVLACESRHRFQAVGSVAFTSGGAGCDDEDRQVATLAMHGTADLVVPYAGRSVPLIRSVLGWDLQPAEEAIEEKAQLNGCDGFDDEPIGADVIRRTWRDCDAATVFYRIEAGGHGWPGPLPALSPVLATTDTIDASELIVEFFDQH